MGYRKQCKVLQLQEKDRVRCQDMARQLVLQRKRQLLIPCTIHMVHLIEAGS